MQRLASPRYTSILPGLDRETLAKALLDFVSLKVSRRPLQRLVLSSFEMASLQLSRASAI